MLNDWKVSIGQDYRSISKNIFIYREAPGGKVEVVQPDGEISLFDKFQALKTSLKLLPEMYEALVKFVMAKEKPINSTFLEGKVEAMGEHLADMRTLVFGEPKIINEATLKNDSHV